VCWTPLARAWRFSQSAPRLRLSKTPAGNSMIWKFNSAFSRETAVGADHAERLAEIAKQKMEVESRLLALKGRREKEFGLVSRIREVRTQLESAPAQQAAIADGATAAQPALDIPALRTELSQLESELSTLQGESPLMRVCVDAQITGEVISAWTGIPVGKMQQDEINTVLSLQSLLGTRVIGQTHALDAISQRISTSRRLDLTIRVSLSVVFMFVGLAVWARRKLRSPGRTCCMAATQSPIIAVEIRHSFERYWTDGSPPYSKSARARQFPSCPHR